MCLPFIFILIPKNIQTQNPIALAIYEYKQCFFFTSIIYLDSVRYDLGSHAKTTSQREFHLKVPSNCNNDVIHILNRSAVRLWSIMNCDPLAGFCLMLCQRWIMRYLSYLVVVFDEIEAYMLYNLYINYSIDMHLIREMEWFYETMKINLSFRELFYCVDIYTFFTNTHKLIQWSRA